MIWVVKYLLYVWCLNVSTAFGCKTWKWLKRLDEVNAEIGHWDWQKNSMLTSKLALIPLFHAASKILSHQWLFYWSKSECLFKSIGRQEKCSHSVESNSLKKNTCSSGFPGGSMVKNPPIDAGDMGSIPGLGRSSGGGHGNPLRYSCLANPTDRGAWRAPVHGVTKNWTWQSTHAKWLR